MKQKKISELEYRNIQSLLERREVKPKSYWIKLFSFTFGALSVFAIPAVVAAVMITKSNEDKELSDTKYQELQKEILNDASKIMTKIMQNRDEVRVLQTSKALIQKYLLLLSSDQIAIDEANKEITDIETEIAALDATRETLFTALKDIQNKNATITSI